MEGSVAFSGTLIGGITGGGEGTNNYNDLINKPSINGIPLSGNKTSSDLHLFTGDYSDLNNKPTINGVTVEGNLTSADLNMFDGDYDHLTNKPTLFSGDYDDLTDKPTINGNTLVGNKTTSDLGLFSGNYNDLTNKPTLFSGDYDDLTDKPRINNHTLSGNMSSADLDIFSGDYDDLTNKPTLFSGDYNDLTNKPTIPVIEFNPVAPAVDEVEKASLNGVVYDIKDAAARSDAALAIENAASVYDPEAEYAVGDYCTHDGLMYQCNTAIVSPGEEWDSDHWDITDAGIELTEINSALTNLHINPYSIITSQQVSTTEATYNTYDSRKFSDYDLLIFAFTNGTDDIRETKVYPAIEWTAGRQIVCQTLHGSSQASASTYNVSGLVIKYNSDTSVKASGGGANIINYFRIFGVKLGVR